VSGYKFFIGVGLDESAVSIHFKALANELVRRGHQVVLLPWGKGSQQQARNGNPSLNPWPSARPTHLADAIFLRQLIKQHEPHCMIGLFGAVNVMTAVGWLSRVPCRVAWYRTLSHQILQDWNRGAWRYKFLTIRKKWVYRICTHVIGNSKATIEDIITNFKVPQQKSMMFYNSLPDPNGGNKKTLTKQAGLVVCAGRFHPSKGQDVLLKAAAMAREHTQNIKVRFLGQGPLQNECEQRAKTLQIENACDFLGHVSHEDVLHHMGQASVTVVPSRAEAFGFVALESMAVGTPVIASRVGGLAEIVRDELDGFLIPPDNPEILADRLCIILNNSSLRNQMGQQARGRFLETFEQKRAVQTQADWFEEIVAASQQK